MGKVLHASASGYFTGCIKEQNLLKECFSGNLTQVMALFWRVKKWEATITGSLQRTLDGVTHTLTFDGTTRELDSQSPSPTTEEDLVCFNGEAKAFLVYIKTANWYASDGIPQDDTFGLLISSGYRSDDEYSGVEKTEDDYRVFGETLLGPTFLINGNGNTAPDYSPLVEAGSYNITFYDGTLTGKLWSTFADTTASCVITVNAKEYWSYDGTYNTSSGAPL
jgi:hypothetical protein